MHFSLWGLNHRTAPVELREKVAFSQDELPEALRTLSSLGKIRQCLILSTCNRTEVYVVQNSKQTQQSDREPVPIEFLSQYKQVLPEHIRPSLYHMEHDEAIRHLFQVACGIDSMVLGENEILGQVRDAYAAASNANCTGTFLNRVAHAAFRVGKQVRNKTGLNQGSLSVSHAACDLAFQKCPSLMHEKVLIIGAGETAELAAQHLQRKGVDQVVLTSRTYEHAQAVAELCCFRAVPFASLEDQLTEAHVIIACTASQAPVVLRSMLESSSIRTSHQLPKIIIDLAIPRDVEESVQSVQGLQLYNIDDIQDIVRENAAQRESEKQKAMTIIDEALESFNQWQQTLIAKPTIQDLKALFDSIRNEQLQSWESKLSPEEFRTAERTADSVTGKIFHRVISGIKTCTCEENGEDLLNVIRKIFDLPDKDNEKGHPS